MSNVGAPPPKKVKVVYRTRDVVDGEEGDWATDVPDREPEWRVYEIQDEALGAMKFSLEHQFEATLYKKQDSQWVEEFSITEPAVGTNCIVCKAWLITDMKCGPGYHHLGFGHTIPGHPAPVHLQPKVCVDCACKRFRVYGRGKEDNKIDPYTIPDINGNYYSAPYKVYGPTPAPKISRVATK